jgi:hypothetical protein
MPTPTPRATAPRIALTLTGGRTGQDLAIFGELVNLLGMATGADRMAASHDEVTVTAPLEDTINHVRATQEN